MEEKEDVIDMSMPLTQAQRVIYRFGGVKKLAEALESVGKARTETTIRRWAYPESYGSGGLIPSHALPDVLRAARLEGILLSAEDLDPREMRIRPINGPAKPGTVERAEHRKMLKKLRTVPIIRDEESD